MQWRTVAAASWASTGEGSSGETARVMRVADGTSTSSGTCVVQCGVVWYGASSEVMRVADGTSASRGTFVVQSSTLWYGMV